MISFISVSILMLDSAWMIYIHIKSDGENFMPKTPVYSEVQTLSSRLTKAIQKGAVVVGRGRQERTVPEILWSQTSVFPVQTSFAAKLLMNLRNQKDA